MYEAFLKKTICLLLIFTILFAKAQTKLYGLVKDQNGKPLSFASVKLKKDSISYAKQFDIATEKGYYEIICSTTLHSGFLEASAVGYKSQIIYIERIQGIDFRRDFSLSPLANNTLPEVFLKSDPPVAISGDTISFKVDAFKLGNEDNIGKLINNMPGFTLLESGKIIFGGRLINKILIEGDDLAGKDYDQLTKSLDITGIDKILVIQNYSDPEIITSDLKGSPEQVLNIKYKKKFLGKIFGNVEGFLGTQPKYYNIKEQLTSLRKNIKLITLQETNTIGDMKISGQENELFNNILNNNEFSEISLPPLSSLAEISDIRNPNTKNELIYSNHSNLSSINYKFKLIKKVTIKGTSGYIRDIYNQHASLENIIYIAPQNIIFRQAQELKKRNFFLDNSISINYLINNHNQLSFNIITENSEPKHQANGLLQGHPYMENLNGNNKQYTSGITYTHLLKKRSALIFDIIHQRSSLSGLYNLTPSSYDSLFNLNTYQFIQQAEFQKSSSFSGSVLFLKKKLKNTLTLKASGRIINNELLNTIWLYNSPNTIQPVPPDSTNNIKFHQQEIRVKIQDQWQFNTKLSFIFSTELLYLYYNLKDYQSVLKKIQLVPGISLNLQLSKIHRIGLSFTNESIASSLKYLAPGYILTGTISTQKGYDSLQSKMTQTLNFFFSHTDFIKKGVLFFSQLTFVQRPLFYLPNILPNQDYTFSKYEITNKKLRFISFLASADKYIFGSKSKISSQCSITSGRSYNRLNSIESEINFIQMNIGASFNIQTKKFKISWGSKYFLTKQKTLQSNSQKIASPKIEIHTNTNWKITPFIFFSFNIQNEWTYPPNQKAIHLFLSNTEINFHSKNEKWQWGINCNNLLNQASYSYSTLLPNQTFFTEYRLFPRSILVSAKYKF